MDKPPIILLAGIRWDFLWQRHQALATLFARAGYPTVFVETTGLANPRPDRATLGKVLARIRHSGGRGRSLPEKNLTVYSPVTAPPTHGAFRRLNEKLFVPRMVRDLRKMAGEDPIVVAYPPTRTTLALISGLRPRRVLYDCSDDYEAFPGAPKDIAGTERELLGRADLISCTSIPLLEKVRPVSPDAFLSGPGVDYEHFSVLQEKRSSQVRAVCFFGQIDERLDLSIFRTIAAAGFEVRLVGGVGRVDRRFLETPGIVYRGEVPHTELPAALAGVDAFVLPYKVNALTRGISPAKTYECLATGRPVVSAPLPSMADLEGYVYLAEGPDEFVKTLRELERSETLEKRRARVDLARANSWEARFEELETRLCHAP